MAKAEAAPEPDLVEVNRLIRAEPGPGTVNKTIDVEHALAVLRAENDHLRKDAKVSAERAALDVGTYKKESRTSATGKS